MSSPPTPPTPIAVPRDDLSVVILVLRPVSYVNVVHYFTFIKPHQLRLSDVSYKKCYIPPPPPPYWASVANAILAYCTTLRRSSSHR